MCLATHPWGVFVSATPRAHGTTLDAMVFNLTRKVGVFMRSSTVLVSALLLLCSIPMPNCTGIDAGAMCGCCQRAETPVHSTSQSCPQGGCDFEAPVEAAAPQIVDVHPPVVVGAHYALASLLPHSRVLTNAPFQPRPADPILACVASVTLRV